MSQSDKAFYYRALKEAGARFDKHYREYSTDELQAAYALLREGQPDLPPEPPQAEPTSTPARPVVSAPFAQRDPDEMAGQRLNTKPEDVPIRTDEQGRVWYQEEVLKPGYAKPRGRRVLQYTSTGTKTVQIKDGEYLESFEVAGDGPAVTGQIKITLPSYQAGIYKDPRFPFRIHTYNGIQGFDLFEVRDFYGGPELVPAECKLMYVENVLCYDIRTTVRAIQTEHRQLMLAQQRGQ